SLIFCICGVSCLYASATDPDSVVTPADHTTRSDLMRFFADPVTVIASSPFFACEYDHPRIADEMTNARASIRVLLSKYLFRSPFIRRSLPGPLYVLNDEQQRTYRR